MSKKQVITALAQRYARRAYAGSTSMHTGWMKAGCAKAIVQHATNWRAQHGTFPTGVHVCRLKGDWGKGNSYEVDFDRLLAHDPDYPEGYTAAAQRRLHSAPPV